MRGLGGRMNRKQRDHVIQPPRDAALHIIFPADLKPAPRFCISELISSYRGRSEPVSLAVRPRGAQEMCDPSSQPPSLSPASDLTATLVIDFGFTNRTITPSRQVTRFSSNLPTGLPTSLAAHQTPLVICHPCLYYSGRSRSTIMRHPRFSTKAIT